jgi:hypothetical protein
MCFLWTHFYADTGEIIDSSIFCIPLAGWFGGSTGGSEVAGGDVAYAGAPADTQTCKGSQPIGDVVGALSINGNTQTFTIANVTAIQGNVTFAPINNQKMAMNSNTLGWVYQDNGGHYWVAANPQFAPSFSVGVNAWFATVSVNNASNPSPQYYGTTLPPLPAQTFPATCWSSSPMYT